MFYVVRSHGKQAYIAPEGLRGYRLTKSLKEACKFPGERFAKEAIEASDSLVLFTTDLEIISLAQAELVGDYPEVEAIAWVG